MSVDVQMESVRQQLEANEERLVGPRGQRSVESRGRRHPIKTCELRTAYMRDRDRILHSKSFRRLSHKTQVFLSPEGDHYRTRLTHTLEVTQISRTVARALELNEDLAEAIALAHDLGHTPFGHVGEEALSEMFRDLGARSPSIYPGLQPYFNHNEQSLRVVDFIEYEGKGLNLTEEVRDGILNHTGEQHPATLEGQIVRIADRIAYVNHDIDDAIRAGLLTTEALPPHPVEVLGRYHGVRINKMVGDMIATSRDKPKIAMSAEVTGATSELREFLFENIYMESAAKIENPKAKRVLRTLFKYYLEKPAELPPEFQPGSGEEVPVKVGDYVAGMTDRYALRRYEDLFLPRAWVL